MNDYLNRSCNHINSKVRNVIKDEKQSNQGSFRQFSSIPFVKIPFEYFFRQVYLSVISKLCVKQLSILNLRNNSGSLSKTCSFIKNRLQHRCFPVNLRHFFRTSFSENNCKGMYRVTACNSPFALRAIAQVIIC